MNLEALVDASREDMVKTLQGAVKINSVEAAAEPGFPFGKGPAECLAYMLQKQSPWAFVPRT